MIVLHGIEGPEGWLSFHDALAAGSTVLAPTLPGFGESERPAWIETVPHVALFNLWLLQELGIGEVDLVGLGVGGWIAAEMAVMCPRSFRRLVLVDAAGLRPEKGEVLDIFILPWREVVRRCFFDADASEEYHRVYDASPIVDFGGPREAGRSMTMRIAYRPYMHDPALAPLLRRVQAPSLVVWGDKDAVVPIECGHMFAEAIPGAELRLIESCGHWPHYERPQELARLVRGFIG
jgi:pimeloyl-ACP methyl ester carboxylesterase